MEQNQSPNGNSTQDINLTAMPTPNPNTIKFLMSFNFLPMGSIEFTSDKDNHSSPIVARLLEIDGIERILIGTNFISVSKHADAGWDTVLDPATAIIKSMVGVETPLIDQTLIDAISDSMADDDAVVKRIRDILDNEIRPAIAMDGGDCQLLSFIDGIVTLQLQGACSSCPSATMTLKMGIENRLKEEIPEVVEVVQSL